MGQARFISLEAENIGSLCPAYYVPATDSGSGVAYLVFGGDWGIRFKPLLVCVPEIHS